MSDETTIGGTATLPAGETGALVASGRELALLPGEVRPHPSPFQYVMIAIVLCVITALEVSMYYLEGHVADGIIITLLLVFAATKFFLVASWYMHLRTDRPIFRRFFIVGIFAAVTLYAVVLTTLHIWD